MTEDNTGLTLLETARALFSDDKGLLAMDESTTTCNKRFAALNIPQTEESRRAYRELILTTQGLGDSISGVILCDETIRQSSEDGTSFLSLIQKAGIVPGIKVDRGLQNLALHPGEKITEGLDGLRGRLDYYSELGARFAKWRTVTTIGAELPTSGSIEANAQTQARYAALCQESGILPIVEVEVLMTGEHTLEQCCEVTEDVLRTVFSHLYGQGVRLDSLVLKTNMVLPGLNAVRQESLEKIAFVTLECLLRCVPAAVPGIALLSGGQSPELASSRLNAIHYRFKTRLPWSVGFSFSRALQQPALSLWKGDPANVKEAQAILVHRAACNRAARRGTYTMGMETEPRDSAPRRTILGESEGPTRIGVDAHLSD